MLDYDVLNSGGLYRLIVVSDDGFETSPILGAWPSIKLKPSAVSCEFLFAVNTGVIGIGDNLSENGLLFEIGIGVDLPKMTPELRDWMEMNGERRWVCFAEDFNEYTHIIGEPGIGAVLTINQSSGESSVSRNVSQLAFRAFSNYRPIISIMNFVDLTTDRKIIDLREYALTDIITYQGDTISEPLIFRDAVGNIENLTGNSFKMQVFDSTGAIVTSYEMGAGFSLQNLNTELFLFKNTTVPVGEYDYDLQRTYPDGLMKTQMAGKYIVQKQFTT